MLQYAREIILAKCHYVTFMELYNVNRITLDHIMRSRSVMLTEFLNQ